MNMLHRDNGVRSCFQDWLRRNAWLLATFVLAALAIPGRAEDVPKVFSKKDYPGSRDRQYIVHLPPAYNPAGQPVPLVMVLHGCCENHKDIQHDSNFDAVADREGFIVVYPFITSYPQGIMDPPRNPNCWGFWIPEQIHHGAGEVQDLGGIIAEVQRDYRVDSNRIHVAGLSSGAAMSTAMLVVHSQVIASGSPTAGLPYGETSSSVGMPGIFKPVSEIVNAMKAELGATGRAVPIFIIHSTGDQTVNIRSCDNTRDSWGTVFGVDTEHDVGNHSGTNSGTPWTHKQYGPPGKPTLIETLVVEGLKHGWYGGRSGTYAFPNAPNTAEMIWTFFKSHPLQQAPNLTLTITSATADTKDQNVTLKGRVKSDGSLEGVTIKVELRGRSPQPTADAQVDIPNQTWAFTSQPGLPNNLYYRPRVIATGAAGVSVTLDGEPIALGQPNAQPPELTIDSIETNLDQVKLRGAVQDDFGIDMVQVRVNGNAWANATLSGAQWSFQSGNLPEGTNVFDARAVDKDTLETLKTCRVTVQPPYDEKKSGTLTDHMVAQRFALYGAKFGAADTDYNGLYKAHGVSESFPLYRARGKTAWYADYKNIPLTNP